MVASYPRLSHRYYALKAKVMGKTRLDHWDRNAPLTAAIPRRYGWDEARGMVLESFDGARAALRRPPPRASSTSPGSTPRRGPASSRAPTRTR